MDDFMLKAMRTRLQRGTNGIAAPQVVEEGIQQTTANKMRGVLDDFDGDQNPPMGSAAETDRFIGDEQEDDEALQRFYRPQDAY